MKFISSRDVHLTANSVTGDVEYLVRENNPGIITEETYKAVQEEKSKRSNVTKDEQGNQLKNKKYSSKK